MHSPKSAGRLSCPEFGEMDTSNSLLVPLVFHSHNDLPNRVGRRTGMTAAQGGAYRTSSSYEPMTVSFRFVAAMNAQEPPSSTALSTKEALSSRFVTFTQVPPP